MRIIAPREALNTKIMECCNIISEPLLLLPSVAICGRIMTRMTRAWPRPKQHCLARGRSRDASAFLPLLHPPPFDDLMLPCVHIGRSHIILEAKMKESPCTTFDCEPLKSWVYGRVVTYQLPVHPDSELESFLLIQSQLKRLFDYVILTHFS